MSIAFETAWYVDGDPQELLFENKMAAEIWARKLFPDEGPYDRYARIYSTQRQQTLITEKQVKETTP